MHIPDGFINAGTSAAVGVIAVGCVAVSVRKASDDLDDRQVPLAGLVAAFIFAVQMLNFPVASGTSGHLLGGVLAAVLVGPWVGALCVTVVLLVQALLFADGGLSALGLNIVNMAIVGAWGGYVGLPRRAPAPAGPPARRWSRRLRSPPGWRRSLAAIAFTVEYAIGGNGAASIGDGRRGHGRRARADRHRRGRHHRADRVGAVMATRPDLVYGARDLGRHSVTSRRSRTAVAGGTVTASADG